MVQFRSVLVPLDGSPLAEQALSAGIGLARRLGSTLHLAMVHHTIPTWALSRNTAPVLAEIDSRARAAETEYLTSLAAHMRATWNLLVTTALLDGPVAETLERYVAGKRVNLVVMTTHGRGGLSRMWLGSVADTLVRRLRVPVLLMRPSEDTKKPVMDVVFRRILIPLDGSLRAEAALEPALALGAVGDAEFLLLRIVEPRLPDYLPIRDSPDIKEDSLLGRDLEARRYLRRVMERLWAKDAKVRTGVYVAGTVPVEVLRQADTAGADLIAMATRGAGGVERLLLGSVADKVLRGSDIPLLIIRPQDADREEARAEEPAVPALETAMP